MPFEPKNEYSYKPEGDKALAKSPVCFKVEEGVKERLQKIPHWQDRLREYVDTLISEHKSGD